MERPKQPIGPAHGAGDKKNRQTFDTSCAWRHVPRRHAYPMHVSHEPHAYPMHLQME